MEPIDIWPQDRLPLAPRHLAVIRAANGDMRLVGVDDNGDKIEVSAATHHMGTRVIVTTAEDRRQFSIALQPGGSSQRSAS
jgi:hypothetical protein